MKKTGNINISKVMEIVKSRHNKRIAAAAVAVLLTAAVVTTSVFNRTQAAENADTLMGIEKLRNKFSNGTEYTVLEIVPDITEAEIGYLFDGYEPILSEWDSETMAWRSWKDILCGMPEKADRKAFMDGDPEKGIVGKKAQLQAYYDEHGLKDNVPVDISDVEYDDSEEYQEGYEEVVAGSYEKTGYFTPDTSHRGEYYVSFKNEKQDGAVYYRVSDVNQILSESTAKTIAPDTYIYKLDGAVYICVGTWASVKDTIVFPNSDQEETDDGNKDDKGDDGTEGGTGDDGNEGDTGNGDGGDGSEGDTGNGDDGDGNEGDTGNGDGGDGNDTGNGDGTGTGDNGNENDGNTGNSEGGNGNGSSSGSDEGVDANNDAAGARSTAGTALKNSASDVKWLKYIGSDVPNNDEADSKTEGGSGSDNSSGSGQNNSSSNGSNDNDQNGQTTTDGGNTGTGTGDGGDNAGGGTGDGGDNAGNGTGDGGDNTGDGGDNTGEGTGDDGDDAGDGTGNNGGTGTGDGGNNKDDGKEDPDKNKGDGNSDNDQNGDDTDDNGDEDKDKEDNTDDDPDAEPGDKDKDSGKDLDKNPNKGNITAQDVSRANEDYYLVYFEKAVDGEYIVDEIRPAKYGHYEDEKDHATGQYNFTDDKEGDNVQTYTFPGKVLYCKGIFHNNEWFKQYVINMNKENFDNFKVKVITLTPEMLNKIYEEGTDEYEQGTIPDFDFLYLNSGIRKSDIVITAPSDEPNNNEDNDNTGDDGGNDNTGDNGDNGDNDKTGDNGDTDNTGDNNNTGDDGDTDNTGDNNNTGDDGDTDNTGDNGDANSGNGGNVDNSTDNSNTEDNANAGNNTESSDNSNNSDNNKNSDDAENKSSESKTNNINNSSYSGKSSLWKAFVSTDDSVDASKSEVSADSDTSKDADKSSTGTTDNKPDDNSTENEDKTGTAGDTNNNDSATDDTNNGATADDAENNNDNADDADNKDNTDDTDGEGAGDATEPDNSEEGNGEGTDNNEEPSTGSDSTTGDKSDSSIVLYSTAGVDLKDAVSNLIFKTVSAKGLPCLVDGSILYGKTEGSGAITDNLNSTEHTEVFRLAAMLCQETLEKDYTGLSKEALMKGIVEDADKNYTTEQVYCRLGNGSDSIINDNFFNYTIYKEGGDIEEGFQNVLDEIKLENLYRQSDTSGKYKPLPTNIAQAEAVRHILNYQNRRNVETKKSIKVLEIQPAYTTAPELTKKQIQKWAPGVEEVETTIMTTAEFIGKIDKINEIYDLIYIGTSKEHLNIKNWVTDTGKSKDNKYLGSTVFNDSEMDGLIYYNVGDKRVVNLPMSGLLDSEYKNGRTYYYNFARYSGNDITKEKEEALISFLDGSYPIVVSDDFIEQPVTVFEDEDYAGCRATLNVGEYKEADLLDNQIFAGSGTPTKGISSIQVKKGYQITLFENPDFTGDSITLKEDVNNFTTSSARLAAGQTWNNRCRSAIVEKVEDAQPVKALDGNHIDNSSYLYDFARTALEKKYNNFYAYGDIDENGSELFKFYLNRPKASLIEFSANGLPSGSLDGTSIINDVYYIYPNTVGRYTLQYYFTIKNEGAASMDTRYNCKLYIDVNADGKFSEFEEVADIVMTNRQNGGVVSSNELYAGVPYTITREVPNGYKGLLPWKVEVCQVNNDNIYASAKGYTKLNGMDKETLKICQINKNTTDELKVIDLNYEIETKGRYFNTLVHGGDYDGVHYPGIDKDFDLQVESIDISTFESYYNPSSPDYNTDYLKDFNMLILGFSDAYDDFTGVDTDPKTPLGAVIEFIDSGKSVLMGHDNTSYWNNPIVDGGQSGYINRNSSEQAPPYKPDSRFAANINKYIRPIVGMDRYGVLSSPTVKRGVALKEGDAGWKDLFSSGKEVAYKPKSARKETVPEAQGFTYAIINVRDTDKDSNEKRDYTKYNLYSGDYNNRLDFTNTYVSQRFDTCYYSESYSDNGEINSATKSQNTSGKVQNVHATQVNQGQITEYPYKLKEDFEVAQTHAQYYQLDYTADDDGDGQSDLVVWYCLGGRTSGSKERQTTIYSQSPNDVRNNYYIYNKGNITYSGLGHGANDKKAKEDNLAYTFEEAKLFINTIIASYQAGVKPPTITVLESGLPDASQLTTMYRYYDSQHDVSITDLANKDNYEKVYFTVRDVNFVKGIREIETHAYYHSEKTEGSGTTITVGGEEISVTRLDDLIYDPETDNLVDAYHLTSGKIYYILVDKAIISDCEKGLDIYFEAQSTVTTNTTTQNVYTTDKVYAKLQVLRAYLFELD